MLVGMVLCEEVRKKCSQALIPSLCGILVYSDETSSVTSKELAGKLPMVRSLLRKSLVSLTRTAVCELKVEGGSQRSGISVPWDGC